MPRDHSHRRCTIDALEKRLLFAVVFTVTNTNDSGDGSLRAAINNANVTPTPQSAGILFDIPGKGVHTIKPASQLPTITVQVDIEGTTDSKGRPLIEIDGENAGDNLNNGIPGLDFDRNTNSNDKSSVVTGLIINRFSGNGIVIGGSAPTDVYGCRIGTDPTGTIAEGNLEGIFVTGNNSQIGLAGSGAAFATIISGNTDDGVDISGNNDIVQNCSIGADANGEELGNGAEGIGISGSYNLIGGDRSGEGNLIVDNSPDFTNPGISIGGQFNVVLANTIQDNNSGIELDGASNNQIGDGSDADQNLINGSRDGIGIALTDSSNNNLIDDNVIGYKPFDKVVDGNASGVQIVNSSDNTLTDDIIDSNDGDGVEIMCIGNNVAADANQITNCFIGTDPAKDDDGFLGNTGNGIDLEDGTNTQINDNLIFNSGLDGIHLVDSTGNNIDNNTILDSVHDGVRMIDSSSNSMNLDTVGGSHGDGVFIRQSTGTAQNNEFDNCDIGTSDDNDDKSIPNGGDGIDILDASKTTINNTFVENNKQAGVEINGATATGDEFTFGGIFNNGKLGISIGDNSDTDHPNHDPTDVADLPDGGLNHPVLTSAVVEAGTTTIHGTFVGTPNTHYEVDFYETSPADASGFGEGQKQIGEIGPTILETDADGNETFTDTVDIALKKNQFVTAIAYHISGSGIDMSEFSNAMATTGASISGSVFNDVNGNGKKDPKEAGLAKQLVYIDTNNDGIFESATDQSAKTDANGNYEIFGAPTGIKLHVRLKPATGFVQTVPGASNPTYHPTLTALEQLGGLIFGEKKSAAAAKPASAVAFDWQPVFTADAALTRETRTILDDLFSEE